MNFNAPKGEALKEKADAGPLCGICGEPQSMHRELRYKPGGKWVRVHAKRHYPVESDTSPEGVWMNLGPWLDKRIAEAPGCAQDEESEHQRGGGSEIGAQEGRKEMCKESGWWEKMLKLTGIQSIQPKTFKT